MALGESLLFYTVIGIAVAAAVAMTDSSPAASPRAFTIIAAVFFWPLFVPMLLARKEANHDRNEPTWTTNRADADDAMSRGIAQVDAELVAALASLDGWAEGAVARQRMRINDLRAAWRAQANRIREMDKVLSAAEIDPPHDDSAEHDTTARAAQATRARQENFARLRQVRDQAHRDLTTTLESVRELVSMIHLAKFTGEPAAKADELVTQIAAAVEGLSEVVAWNETPAA